jgi:tetratricopeptide (TPR) repeat protein
MTARNAYILLAALALASASACGDDVTVKGFPPYSDAKINGIEDGQLLFETNGQTVRKALDAIAKMHITGQDNLNEAEDLMAKGNVADAIKAYDLAVDRAGDVDWLKQLAVARRLKALGQAPDKIDRAVTEWLALLDQTKGAKFAITLRPTKLAVKGSKANDDAIAALESKEGESGAEGPALSAIRRLLADLYQAQGNADKAKAMAAKMGGKPVAGQTPQTGDNPHTPAASGGSPEELLQTAESQIGHGNADQALTSLKGSLQQFTVNELPKALMLMGKAQMEMAKTAKGEQAKELLDAAGLNFMRVVTFYPTITEVPAEAGYLAGKVSLELGNRSAARAAFNRVRERYNGSPFAAQADKAVSAMENK